MDLFENKLVKFYESILDPLKSEMNSSIWNNMKMKPEVKKELLETLQIWLETNGIGLEQVKSLVMIGSNTGYQYSNTSDIDINVELSITDEEIKNLRKQLPNGNLLKGTEHPVNYYLLNKPNDFIPEKGASYDLMKDEWIVSPSKETGKVPFTYVVEVAKIFMDSIDLRIRELSNDLKELELYLQYKTVEDSKEMDNFITNKKNEIKADFDGIKIIAELLHGFREEGYNEYSPENKLLMPNQKGNMSIQNQIYKILEKFGYLEKLKSNLNLRKAWQEQIGE